MFVHRHNLYTTLLCKPWVLSCGQYIIVTALPKVIQIILHCPVDVCRTDTMYVCVGLCSFHKKWPHPAEVLPHMSVYTGWMGGTTQSTRHVPTLAVKELYCAAYVQALCVVFSCIQYIQRGREGGRRVWYTCEECITLYCDYDCVFMDEVGCL